jgi:hypothetical protein
LAGRRSDFTPPDRLRRLSPRRRAKRDEEAAGSGQPEAVAAAAAVADAAKAPSAKAAAKAKEAAETLALLGPPPSHTELTALVTQIVPFHMAHNAEVEVRAAVCCCGGAAGG